MLTYLILGRRPQEDESLLRPKVHTSSFPRPGQRWSSRLDGKAGAVRLHLSLETPRPVCGPQGRRFLPVLTCKTCGQLLPGKYYRGLEFSQGSWEPDPRPRTATRSRTAGFPTPSGRPPPVGRKRLLLTDRLLEGRAFPPDRRVSQNGFSPPRDGQDAATAECVYLPAVRAMRKSASAVWPTAAYHPSLWWSAYRLRGPAIGAPRAAPRPSRSAGGRSSQPRKIQAVTVSKRSHPGPGHDQRAAPEGHKKLIIFADSRQDAAFQAGWMQDHAAASGSAHDVPGDPQRRHRSLWRTSPTDSWRRSAARESLIDALLPRTTRAGRLRRSSAETSGCQSARHCGT